MDVNYPPQKATNVSEPVPVPLTAAQKRFYASDDCSSARLALQQLVDNPQYETDSSYFSGSELLFIDRHLWYLSTHPGINLTGYLSNLKLMTRTKRG